MMDDVIGVIFTVTVILGLLLAVGGGKAALDRLPWRAPRKFERVQEPDNLEERLHRHLLEYYTKRRGDWDRQDLRTYAERQTWLELDYRLNREYRRIQAERKARARTLIENDPKVRDMRSFKDQAT